MNIRPRIPKYKNRDIFILSKGHAAVALYATLCERGYFSLKILERYGYDGSKIAGHVIRDSLPGIEATAGSLGHGLSMAAGMALSAKLDKEIKRRFYCLLGDGECNEGAVWEAIIFAGHHHLNNLVAIVDMNGEQGLGVSKKVLDFSNMADRWRAFGWDAKTVDGHDLKQIISALKYFKNKKNFKPSVLVAKTIKGKGVSFMENSTRWHYKSPSFEEYQLAIDELSKA